MDVRVPVPAEVGYISSDTIRAASDTKSTQRLELTPWDLSLLGLQYIQRGLLFHQPKEHLWLTHLKNSLSHTLDHFFPLAGRLATETHDDNTISVFIQCNNAGVEFIHAAATTHITVSDVLDPLDGLGIIGDFFPYTGMINYDGQSIPLLAVQVTELVDGVFIACTMNHAIADGGAFWHFMNSWSEICKSDGSAQISGAPCFNTWFVNEGDLPIRIPASKMVKIIKSSHSPPPLPLAERVFHLSQKNISKLKSKANLEYTSSNTNTNTNTNTNSVMMISSLQAVLAHLWRAVTRARNLDSDQEISYCLLLDNRSRLNPPLPEMYFGNSVSTGVARAKAGELMNQGLGFAAGLLNQIVSSHTNAEICRAWVNSVNNPIIICYYDLIALYSNTTLLSGGSPWFNMYGNDFGWGCPISVRSGGANKLDGRIIVNQGAVIGSMDIEVWLSPKTLRGISEDPEFMEFVGAL